MCAICLNQNVEVFFPNCGHVCVCIGCLNKLLGLDKLDIFDDIRPESHLIKNNYEIDKYKIQLKDYPSYLSVYEGMGCNTFIRRLNSESEIEGLFVHSDDHYLQSKMDKIENFIKGYCYIKLDFIFQHDWKGYS